MMKRPEKTQKKQPPFFLGGSKKTPFNLGKENTKNKKNTHSMDRNPDGFRRPPSNSARARGWPDANSRVRTVLVGLAPSLFGGELRGFCDGWSHFREIP